MADSKMQTVTTILAIWGAALATITFLWNVFRDLSKKGKLKVSCWIGNIVTVGEQFDHKEYLFWTVTNIGKEPVVLTHFGGKKKNGKNFMIKPHNPMPITLKPGEYATEHCQQLDILDDDLLHLWAIDSLNRYFMAPRKQVKKLKKEYKNDISKKGENIR